MRGFRIHVDFHSFRDALTFLEANKDNPEGTITVEFPTALVVGAEIDEGLADHNPEASVDPTPVIEKTTGDVNTQTGETKPPVDAAGVPWDAEQHSTPRKLNKDGTWRKRRGGVANTDDEKTEEPAEPEATTQAEPPFDFAALSPDETEEPGAPTAEEYATEVERLNKVIASGTLSMDGLREKVREFGWAIQTMQTDYQRFKTVKAWLDTFTG